MARTEATKRAQQRYRQSEKGKKAAAKYPQSDKGKAAKHRKDAAYRQTESGKVAYANAKNKRRAIIKDAGSYTLMEWNALIEYYDYRCLSCGCNECMLTVDHVIPLSKGGNNTIKNIQPLCQVCNSSKGTKSIDYR